MYFSDLSIHNTITEKLGKKGFRQLTGIQEEIIPALNKEEDSFFSAKKSEGKTLGLIIGISHLLSEYKNKESNKDETIVIFTPSRDAVNRICEEISYYSSGFQEHPCYSLITSKNKDVMAEAIQEYPLIVTTTADFLQAMEWKILGDKKITKAIFYDAPKIISQSDDELRAVIPMLKHSRFYVFSNENKDCVLSPFHSREKKWKRYVFHPEKPDYSKMDQKVNHLSRDEKPAYVIQCIEDAIKENTKGIILVAEKKYTVENLEKNIQYHDIPVIAAYKRLTDKEMGSYFDKLQTREAGVMVATTESLIDFIFPFPGDIYFYEVPTDGDDYVNIMHKTSVHSRVRIFAEEKDIPSLSNIEKYMKIKVPIGEINESFIENISFVRIQWTVRKPERDRDRDRGKGRDRDRNRDRNKDRNRDRSNAPDKRRERNIDRKNADENKGSQPREKNSKNQNYQKKRTDTRVHKNKKGGQSQANTRNEFKPDRNREDIEYKVIPRDGQPKKPLLSRIFSIFSKKEPEKITVSQKTIDRLQREEQKNPSRSNKNHQRRSR